MTLGETEENEEKALYREKNDDIINLQTYILFSNRKFVHRKNVAFLGNIFTRLWRKERISIFKKSKKKVCNAVCEYGV